MQALTREKFGEGQLPSWEGSPRAGQLASTPLLNDSAFLGNAASAPINRAWCNSQLATD